MNKQKDNKQSGTQAPEEIHVKVKARAGLDYNFLFKPAFFIFSLLFATWMVIKIEEIKPSDFGINESPVIQPNHALYDTYMVNGKKYLEHISAEYKAGMIDSIMLDKKLTVFLDSIRNTFVK